MFYITIAGWWPKVELCIFLDNSIHPKGKLSLSQLHIKITITKGTITLTKISLWWFEKLKNSLQISVWNTNIIVNLICLQIWYNYIIIKKACTFELKQSCRVIASVKKKLSLPYNLKIFVSFTCGGYINCNIIRNNQGDPFLQTNNSKKLTLGLLHLFSLFSLFILRQNNINTVDFFFTFDVQHDFWWVFTMVVESKLVNEQYNLRIDVLEKWKESI